MGWDGMGHLACLAAAQGSLWSQHMQEQGVVTAGTVAAALLHGLLCSVVLEEEDFWESPNDEELGLLGSVVQAESNRDGVLV